MIEESLYQLVRLLFGWIPPVAGFVWDLIREYLGWRLGWPVVRGVSLGHFPETGWNDSEHADEFEAIVVCVVGFVMLALLGWSIQAYHFWR